MLFRFLLTSYFFVICYGYHRELHVPTPSFPPLRSSDLAFAPHRQYQSSEPPSPLVFFRISTNFTSTLGIPLTSPGFKRCSFKGYSGVEPRAFTSNLQSRIGRAHV